MGLWVQTYWVWVGNQDFEFEQIMCMSIKIGVGMDYVIMSYMVTGYMGSKKKEKRQKMWTNGKKEKNKNNNSYNTNHI